jgi:hypothetical protein
MKKTLFLSLILLSIISCKNSSHQPLIQQISFGSSFGECTGYCKNEMALDSGKITIKRSGWNNTVKPIFCEVLQDKNVLNNLSKKIDAVSFFNMQEVWGCPDCADGGAEWIEITLRSGKKHKVTFEYLKEPVALKSIAADLRVKLDKTPCMVLEDNVK